MKWYPVDITGIIKCYNMENRDYVYDAIVIGSGISGGWAAKELCEKGLKTLVLERGRDVVHIKDYPTTNMYPYEFAHRTELPFKVKDENPIVSRCYAFREDTEHFFVKDHEHPYIQEKPFDWIRGYQVGGKSLLWARQTQRWSDYDFEGPARDGFAVDWPIRYRDIKPWYDHVEKFIGVSGNRDGLDILPDGHFQQAYPLNIVEEFFKEKTESLYDNRHVISARCAHLSSPDEVQLRQGRVQCQNRKLCERGCPFGGYFSSNSSTLPFAAKTGNLTLRPYSVVSSIIFDDAQQKAKGVTVVDSLTKEVTEYHARLIFVCASTINTNLILLNSKSNTHPNGLGNSSAGILGKYLAFHNYSATVRAECNRYLDYRTDGKNPAGGGYIPRFRNVKQQETEFLRGYAATMHAQRLQQSNRKLIGNELRESLLNPKWGNWQIRSHIMGETIPKESNGVTLSAGQTDQWGMPLASISVDYDENDRMMARDYCAQLSEMFDYAGFKHIQTNINSQAPGLDIHEMGGARMGIDPKTSVLNKWNQLHDCKNVFVTDGACMTSVSTQNPSLTFMALTARAVDYALAEMKKGDL